MISIGFILGSTGALLIGLSVGFHFGVRTGYRRGYKSGIEMPPAPPIFFPQTEPSMRNIQVCSDVRITDDMSPEEIIKRTTSAVYELCKYLVQELIEQGVVRPVFLDGEPHSNIRRIGISFYVSRNPLFDDYPNVVFLRRGNNF